MNSKSIESKITEIEKLREKAVEEKKKLDAKIKGYDEKIELLRMQLNNEEMNMAVKVMNELGGGNGTIQLTDLANLIKNNPNEIAALLGKTAAKSKAPIEASDTDDTDVKEEEE